MFRRVVPTFALTCAVLCAVGATLPAAAANGPFDAQINSEVAPDRMIFWSPDDHDGLRLRVASPCGEMIETVGDPGGDVMFTIDRPDGTLWPDGRFVWEIEVMPVIDPGLQDELEALRAAGETLVDGPIGGIASGAFSIAGGEIIFSTDGEEDFDAVGSGTPSLDRSTEIIDKVGPASAADVLAEAGLPTKDFVVMDDLIVDGSQCVGFDCVNGESFGFDTLRLKENNLRIAFDDTSTAGSYPRRDWQILANDSANGGMERLSVVDVTSGRIPFTIEGNAPANALFVDANGSVGIGTATPTLDLHVTDGNSPALRLEQTTAAGFGPRVWDVGGNEANFFIRDANEGKLPLRIVKKGVDNNLVLREGDVGVGTSAPQASLHVQQKNGDAQLLVEETSETEANRKMFLLKNEGGIEFEMVNTATNGATWFFQNDSNANDPFNISKRGTAGVEMQLNTRRDLLGVATLVIDGSVQATNVQFTSARHRKTAFSAVDADTVLEKVAALPIQTWRYREEANEVRHMGPIAEDFAQAFGLGTSEQHIAMTDLGGVALAAIQGLNARIDTLEARNIELMAQVEALLALAQTATID